MDRRPAIRALLRASTFAAAGAIAASTAADYPVYQQRFGVPDFDQVWSIQTGTFPLGGWGRYHCVPTSYLNIFQYLDDNGLENMAWVLPRTDPDYETSISDELYRLGLGMGTEWWEDGMQGTLSLPAYEYVTRHLAERAPNVVMVNCFYGPDWDWGTRTIQKALSTGSIVRIGYGRYKSLGILGYDPDTWYRDGGHSVTLVGFDYRNDNDKYLMVADPSTGDDERDFEQSPLSYDPKSTVNIRLKTSEHGYVSHARYTMAAGTDQVPQRNIIDSMHQILPVYAGWEDTIVAELRTGASSAMALRTAAGAGKYKGDGSVRVVMPWRPREQAGSLPSEFSFTPRERMVDWRLAVGELSAYYITHLGRVFRVDLMTGEHKLLHVLKGAKKLVEAGSTLDLYVLVEGRQRDRIVKIERDDNKLSTRELPGRGIALEYDPITQGAAVLDANLAEMHTVTEDLDAGATAKLPPLPSGSGAVIFKIDHRSGDLLLSRQGAFEYARHDRRTGRGISTRLRIGNSQGITALSPTENDLVIVQDGTRLMTFDRLGAEQKTQLTGLHATGPFEVTRSHFAAKAWQMTGPGWRNLWPVVD